MKHILTFLLIFIGWMTQSHIAQGQTANRYLPLGDPNLDPSWDWRVAPSALPNPNGHPYYSAGANGSTNLQYTQVPFNTNGHPLSDALTYTAKDMQKEDGWMLVYRDFGSPQAYNDLPFFVLYNRYRGTLRVMVKNSSTTDQYSAYKMTLQFRTSTPRPGLLTFTSDNNTTLDNFNGSNSSDPFQVESFYGNTTRELGWFYADFIMFGFDPLLSNDAVMRISLTSIDRLSLILHSDEFTLDEVLSDNNPGGSGGLEGATKFFKSFGAVQKAAKELPNAGKSVVINRILNATGSSIVPFLGTAVELIDFFIGGGSKAAPREPMKFKGVLNMSGGIERAIPIWQRDFALSMFKTDIAELYRPVQPIPWGIFNINKRPKLIETHFEGGSYYDDDSYEYRDTFYAEYALEEPLSYSFNTSSGLDLISVEVATDRQSEFISLDDFNQLNDYYAYDNGRSSGNNFFTNLFIKTTFRIQNPVINSDPIIVVYKNLGLNKPNSAQRSNNVIASENGASPAKATADMRVNGGIIRPLDIIVAPNPVNDNTSIFINNPEAGPMSLRLLNNLGQQVSQNYEMLVPIGTRRIPLNGELLEGKKLPSGTYILELKSSKSHKFKRILIEY